MRFLYGRLWWSIAPAALAPAVLPLIDDNSWDLANDAELPDWYIYLQDNDFTNTTSVADFGWDEVITRATSTPFLSRFWVLAKLSKKSEDTDCNFADIANKSDDLKSTIITACEYDLLRGSNGNFIPDRVMTKDELLTVLVRTKTGYLAEDTTPRFKNYFDWATNNELLQWDSIDDFSWNVTKSDLGQWLYRLSLLK